MGTITITGGEIHAETAAENRQSYDIGAGHGEWDGCQDGGEISITGGVVYTGSRRGIGGVDDDALTQEDTVIFSSYDEDGEVYGDVTLDSNLTIPEDHTLYIPEGSCLTVSEGHTLTVGSGATLENDGVLDNQGTVSGDGSVIGSGKFEGNLIDYYVSVTVPAFESVHVGYTQPEAHAITIQNKGKETVTISSVEVSSGDFTVEPADSTPVEIQPGNTDESYKIRPNAGLSGLHTATVTVTYDEGRKAAAKVSFMVYYFAEGKGTPESPYQIRNLKELKAFRDFINDGDNCGGEDMYFELMQDIDMSKEYGADTPSWEPIGSNFYEFCGTFNGGGHTIRGLYIKSNSNSNSVQGLFAENAGTISSLNVSGTIICGEKAYAGMIVGMNGGTVTGCNSSGSVTVEDKTGSKYAGGIVGGIVGTNSGVVKDCNSTAHVAVTVVGESGAYAVECGAGGIVGVTGDNSFIQNCAFSGEVTGSVSGGLGTEIMAGIGGGVGVNQASRDAVTVESCGNSGAVSGSGSGGMMTGVGGIMGLNMSGGGPTVVENCLNTGTVSDGINGTVSGAGGIVGTNLATDPENAAVENCCNTGTITGTEGAVSGAVVGVNSAEMSSYMTLSGTVTKCYYLSDTAAKGIGEGGGDTTPKTTNEFASGEVTYLLQNGQETPIWGQTVGSDTPELTGETSKKVYKITGKVDGQDFLVWYTNSNATLPDAAPSKEGFIFAGWSRSDGGAADFTKDSPVSDDTTVYAVWKPDLEGSGTQDAPYLIPDKEALEVFREYVNAGNDCAELYFKVTEDIDLKGNDNDQWTPIGSGSHEFQGTFDGDNHTISGLYINNVNNDSGNYQGLFGYIGESGTAKNLTVDGTVSCFMNGAGIAGQNDGRVENCHNKCNVNATFVNCGGVVGENYSGTVTNCYNTGEITGGNRVGGIVGSSNGTVQDCYNTGNISGENNIGGITGKIYEGTVTNCYNTGKIHGNYAGGITGGNEGAVKNCYNTGNISGESDIDLGGAIGWNDGGIVTNCYYLKGTAENGIGEGDGDATEKTAEEFASGEVAWLLQDGQDTQAWGQKLSGDADNYPVLTTDSDEKVYKVTFATQENENYAVQYVNPNETVALPADPTLTGMIFDHWSTTADIGGATFDETTQITGDTTVYAVGRQTFGGGIDDSLRIHEGYSSTYLVDLDIFMAYQSGEPAEGRFEYAIASDPDGAKAFLSGSALNVPTGLKAGIYKITVTATEKAPAY